MRCVSPFFFLSSDLCLAGLDPEEHLSRTLQEMEPHLHAISRCVMQQSSCVRVTTMRLPSRYSLLPVQVVRCTKHLPVMVRKYGCNICGEGGEYETLTLDCPVFRQASIILDAWQPLLHSEDSVARVGVLHPTNFSVNAKGGSDALVTIAMGDIIEVADEGTALDLHFSPAHPRMMHPSHPMTTSATSCTRIGSDARAEPISDGDGRSRDVTEPNACNSSSVVVKQHWGDELGAVYATVTQAAIDTGDAVRMALLAIASGATWVA